MRNYIISFWIRPSTQRSVTSIWYEYVVTHILSLNYRDYYGKDTANKKYDSWNAVKNFVASTTFWQRIYTKVLKIRLLKKKAIVMS